MAIYYHLITKDKYYNFLNQKRHDPVIRSVFKEKDKVLICSSCKSAFLLDIWINVLGNKHCNQTNTELYLDGIKGELYKEKDDKGFFKYILNVIYIFIKWLIRVILYFVLYILLFIGILYLLKNYFHMKSEYFIIIKNIGIWIILLLTFISSSNYIKKIFKFIIGFILYLVAYIFIAAIGYIIVEYFNKDNSIMNVYLIVSVTMSLIFAIISSFKRNWN